MNYWGKAFPDGGWRHLCLHSVDVAATLYILLESDSLLSKRVERASPIPFRDTLQILTFLAAVHDLGKFSLPFQNLRPELAKAFGLKAAPEYAHHTILGLNLWETRDLTGRICFPHAEAFLPLVVAALSHHGMPNGTAREPRRIRRCFDGTEEDALRFVDEAALFFLPVFPDVALRDESFRRLSWLAAGLFILADWIASNSLWFGPDTTWTSIADHWDSACGHAAKAVTACRVASAQSSHTTSFHELFPHLPKAAAPSPLQQAVMDLEAAQGPELLIFEDLTGGGKTEAALLAAHRAMRSGHATGVFVGLPTMATANAMYARLARSYQALFAIPEASLVLAHGSRSLNEDYLATITPLERVLSSDSSDGGTLCAEWFADNRKKALLAPSGVGTIDQALLAVLSTKHQALRLIGLTRSVLVVDEVHSYDTYTGTLLQNLLTFQAALDGNAVLLSATLPQAIRKQLVEAWRRGRLLAGADVGGDSPHMTAFPLMTRVSDGEVQETPVGTLRTLNVPVELTDDPSIMYAELSKAAAGGACACWIRNTVADAVEARRKLVEELGLPPSRVLLFHARYAGCDRMVREQEVLTRFGKESGAAERAGMILVATQVIEQSLDLDFDLLLSDLAPMELMIQRGGRCHRHERPRPDGYRTPRMLVLSPPPDDDAPRSWYGDYFPSGQWVYPRPALLWRTARLLRDKQRLLLPDEARELVEGAYGNGDLVAPATFDPKEDQALAKDCSDRAVSMYASLNFEPGYDLGSGVWEQDVDALTRLGQPSHRVRLIRHDGQGLRLWASEHAADTSARACMRSEIRVDMTKLAQAAMPSGLEAALNALKQAMPDKARRGLCLILREATQDHWVGAGTNRNGKGVEVRYGPDGLEVD